MQVFLPEKVDKLGEKGEIVKVSDGYARNFLFPKKLGEAITKNNKERILKLQNELKQAKIKQSTETEEVISKLAFVKLMFVEKASKENKLFGAISAKDIVKALKEKANIEIPESAVKLEKPLKEIGEYQVKIEMANKTADISVNIKAA